MLAKHRMGLIRPKPKGPSMLAMFAIVVGLSLRCTGTQIHWLLSARTPFLKKLLQIVELLHREAPCLLQGCLRLLPLVRVLQRSPLSEESTQGGNICLGT
jgi:hypothetical protein